MNGFSALRVWLLSLIVLAAACNSELPTVPQVQLSRVRIVNAAPGVGNVEVVRTGSPTTPLVQNLNYGAFTQSCIQLPADISHTLSFRSGGAEVATTTFTPDSNEKYTAFLTSSGATRRAFVLSDQTTAAAGTNGLRFVNASSGPGDVYVTVPGSEPTPAMRSYANVEVTATGTAEIGYVTADTTRTQVRFYDVGVATGTPRAEFRLSGLPTSRLATVVLTDVATAGPSGSFVVFPC